MLIIAGISLAVFFELLLVTKKNKSGPDVLLALWMFLITAHLFFYYLLSTGAIYEYPFLLGIELPFPLLHGVFLYLYVASLTNQLPARRSLLLLHFLPAGSTYCYLVTFYLLPASEKAFVYRHGGTGFETFIAVKLVAIILSGVLYLTWSSILLLRHRRRILDQFSYQSSIDLQWLQLLIVGMGGIWILILFSDAILFAGVVVFVALIGFFGIRQSRIYAPEPARPPADPEKEKYAKSGLTGEMSDRLYAELRRAMAEDALYKRSDLSLDDLASKLKAHPNYLSQIINEREGKNFYDFVNHYRIGEFKRLLSEPANRNLTLLALALDCGFNSKSSFNRHFKKVTGQTPSEYLALQDPSK